MGLCELELREDFDGVVVMDSDGEDSPQGTRLHESGISLNTIVAMIVAKNNQKKRVINIYYCFYYIYKLVFRLLTGEIIDFGNFCIIPSTVLHRLT